MFNFLKLTQTQAYPRACGYPRVAVTDNVLYSCAGVGAGTNFGSRVRVNEVYIRVDYPLPSLPICVCVAVHVEASQKCILCL